MSLVTDPDVGAAFGANGMTYNRSTDGGLTWSRPSGWLPTRSAASSTTRTRSRPIRTTPTTSTRCGTGCRCRGSIVQPENAVGLGFKGPIYFTRTTDGGDTFEPARKIYETGPTSRPSETRSSWSRRAGAPRLFNFFADITNASNRRGGIGPVKLSYVRSTTVRDVDLSRAR